MYRKLFAELDFCFVAHFIFQYHCSTVTSLNDDAGKQTKGFY